MYYFRIVKQRSKCYVIIFIQIVIQINLKIPVICFILTLVKFVNVKRIDLKLFNKKKKKNRIYRYYKNENVEQILWFQLICHRLLFSFHTEYRFIIFFI